MTGRSLLACYTSSIVIRGFFWTLLLALGLWGSSHLSLLVKGTPATCRSACTCGCCMQGGMCPMRAASAHTSPHSRYAAGAGQSHSGVSCSCTVSQPVVPLMQASHADLLFNLPHVNHYFELPVSIRCVGGDFVLLPAVDNLLQDPPPKAFSS
jgi:hypothetical protein